MDTSLAAATRATRRHEFLRKRHRMSMVCNSIFFLSAFDIFRRYSQDRLAAVFEQQVDIVAAMQLKLQRIQTVTPITFYYATF